MSGLTARHFELYRLMLATAWQEGGRPVCSYGQPKLAARLGVDARTVRRLVADLREPGADPRHPDAKPSGLRLGWLLVLPRERPGAKRGGKLYGANRYVLQLDPAELDDLEARWRSSRSDRRDTADPPSYPQDDPSKGRFPRSDRRDTSNPGPHRRDTLEPLVVAGRTEGTGEPVSLSHVLQDGRDTHPGWRDREPLRSAASGSAARSAVDDQEQARNGGGGPPPVNWRAALGKLTPPDDGERFASREDEEREKRRRAEQLLAPDPPCAGCPGAAAG